MQSKNLQNIEKNGPIRWWIAPVTCFKIVESCSEYTNTYKEKKLLKN